MKKRRRSKKFWISGTATACLVVVLICGGCCLFPFIPRGLHHEAPEMLGMRKDAQGNIVQKIMAESSYRTTGPFPGPHGFKTKRQYTHKYFLEEPGKVKRELTFLDVNRSNVIVECWPVDNSPLWVMAGPDYTPPYIEHKLLVVVFDETRVMQRRTLKYQPNMNLSARQWRLENGNRTLVYPVTQGFEAYDVRTDTVAPWKPPKD